MNLLEIAHKHGIDLEGACEASLACSTCHVIVEDPDVFERTGEISDEENDMLDLAFGLTQTYVPSLSANRYPNSLLHLSNLLFS
jgi:2Fe-2S ferredoxin